MVVFGPTCSVQAKVVGIGKVVVFGQKCLYSDKNGYIRAKYLYSGKSGCIWAKWFYLGKSGCNRKVVVFGKVIVFG